MKKLTLAIIAVLGFGFGASAQSGGDTFNDSHQVTITIPPVALLDIEAGGAAKDITVAFTAPSEAGDPIVAPTMGLGTKWLNYSSILTGGGAASRKVTVESSASVPSAITLGVTAGAPTGTGTPGTGGTVATISTTPQSLITGIGSVYTGDGTSNGSNITYAVGLGTYSALVSGNIVVTVKYTLLDI